jgi:hypothetical protein
MDRVERRAQKALMIFSIVAIMLIAFSASSWAAPCPYVTGKEWTDAPAGTDTVGKIVEIITYDSYPGTGILAVLRLDSCYSHWIKDTPRATYLLSTAMGAFMAGKQVLIRPSGGNPVDDGIQYIRMYQD